MQKTLLAAMAATGILMTSRLAFAAQIDGCDEVGRAAFVVEPWEQNSKTFYNGKVRAAYLDTAGEPVCCSAYLLLLVPDPENETGDRACYVVGKSKGAGFASIGFDSLKASYDPRKGLLIVFPVTALKSNGQTTDRGIVRVRINVTTGKTVIE